jgi:hypothetical protein
MTKKNLKNEDKLKKTLIGCDIIVNQPSFTIDCYHRLLSGFLVTFTTTSRKFDKIVI